jgi:DNA-binding transcriptional regulator YdaS (Cro superfamily)
MSALQRAIDHAGGQTQLARLLGIRQSLVSMWKTRGRVPAEYCPRIERATAGQVRCEDLRPDVEWAYLRCGHGASVVEGA